jgi:ComF family protein
MDNINLRRPLDGIYDILFPPVCLCCDEFIDDDHRPVCRRCWDRIDYFERPFCLTCRSPLERVDRCPICQSERIRPVFSLGQYVDPLKEMIHQFKYHGFADLGRMLAEKLIEQHRSFIKSINADCLVPVPLYSYREKKRGFNQAAVIAEVIGRALKIPLNFDSLIQIKRTSDQAKLTPDKRHTNVIGAFTVDDDNLRDKRIILIDDVITTGATVNEIIKTLHQAGAEVAAIVTIAAAGF